LEVNINSSWVNILQRESLLFGARQPGHSHTDEFFLPSWRRVGATQRGATWNRVRLRAYFQFADAWLICERKAAER